MNKKKVLICVCLVALAVVALAYGKPPRSSQEEAAAAPATSMHVSNVPEHVIYRHIFHHLATLHAEADKADVQGKNSSSLRTVYKRQAGLNDEQARLLSEIALACEREVNQQDAKAKVIINKFLSRYPKGRIPDGETPAPPSPQLKVMQEERNAIILRARDRLRAALGEEEFGRFTGFINREVVPNIHPLTPAQLQNALNTAAR